MLIIEIMIGYVCFLIINVIYDTYIKRVKTPLSRLSIISSIQTAIAVGIYYVVQ